MFELLLQTFWAKKNLVKSLLILHPRHGNLLQWNIFTGLNKTSLHFTKKGGDQLKKICTFFQHERSRSRFLW
jgi:hypothetical protein